MCRIPAGVPSKKDQKIENEDRPSSTSCMNGVGWLARGDKTPEEKRVPFNRPTPRQVYDALPFVRRYFVYWMKHVHKKEKLFINTFEPLHHKPYYGVPCGGIGCGSIGRDFRGGFCKFGLRPGLIEHKVDVVPADQFILSVREPGASELLFQKVLCAANVDRSNGQLIRWDFSIPQKDVTYRGLYPRSWTCYDIKELDLKVVLKQLSPVIPDDYEDTSLPVSSFVFDVENNSGREYEVSVAFMFRNGTGRHSKGSEAKCSSQKIVKDSNNVLVKGVTLSHYIMHMECTYGIATTSKEGQNVSVCRSFDPCGSGDSLWITLMNTGDIPDYADPPFTSRLGVGVCVRRTVAANEYVEEFADFALSWNMPQVAFGNKRRTYLRRYSRFFSGTGSDVAFSLCERVLSRRKEWRTRIEKWQSSVTDHPHLPDWYKSALFNELYFMTDGGSVWFEFDKKWLDDERHLTEYSQALMREHGRFGYLESWEYRMVNTYDVHFYASYALASLWPKLQLTIQAEFTDQVEHSDEIIVKYHMEGDKAPVKTRTRVPHDLGNPADDPWLVTNAYVMHDTGKWKDLNLKFILTSWRDYIALTDKQEDFLNHVYPAVKKLIDGGLENWDKDGDGMIENFGKADQTYDAWQMEGVSAYCGSLWLASLRVSIEMANEYGDVESTQKYKETLVKAKQVFIDKLWNGKFFRFCEKSKSRESVMADQLCGIWFLQSCSPELANELIPSEYILLSLSTIFSLNVCSFGGGRMGAVNGMLSDGTVDRHYIQADEMWTGVTYAVAAFMIQQGEVQNGFDTAFGCYDACFNRFGLQYQTPEAIYEKKFYRAIGYMRPLSIWAMQWALLRHCSLGKVGEESVLIESLRKTPLTLHSSLAPSEQRSDDDEYEGYNSDNRDSDKRSSETVNEVRLNMANVPSEIAVCIDN